MYTGRLFEEDILGRCVWQWSEYVPYRRAMARVKRFQPWDPTDPEPRMANDLHAHVCIALGIEDWSEVALYTSIGSPLDIFHGVDGWFEFHGSVVTIDVTTNPQKGRYKADFIIQSSDQERGLEKVGQEIAQLLKSTSTVRRLR